MNKIVIIPRAHLLAPANATATTTTTTTTITTTYYN